MKKDKIKFKSQKKVFALWEVMLIVVVVSIISSLTMGVILYNNNKITPNVTYSDLANDENLNQFLEVYASITSEYYENVDKEEILQRAISAMMNYLGDDYTTYLNNSDTSELLSTLEGKYEGIGVSINNESKTLVKVYPDTPASKAGLLANDVIIGLDDIDVTDLSGSEVVELIKAKKKDFTLKIKRGEEILSFTLHNEQILKPCIDYYFLPNSKIGYLAITTFSRTLEEQVRSALKYLENNNMTSLIIDLRDNTGGFLDVAHSVASIFLPKGSIIYSLNEKNKITDYKDTTNERKEYKIAILTNKSTASASEILTAALKDNYGAKIVGKTTYGKGKVQQTMKLNGGSMVKYTSAYWLTPKGVCIDEIGITPDFIVENEVIKDDEGNIVNVIDNQLNKAQEILTN